MSRCRPGWAPFRVPRIWKEDATTFSHTFTVKGTYKYICKMHEAMGMVGRRRFLIPALEGERPIGPEETSHGLRGRPMP